MPARLKAESKIGNRTKPRTLMQHKHTRETQEDVSKQTWCLTSAETVRLIRDGEKGGGGGMEMGGEGDYIPIATLSPPE